MDKEKAMTLQVLSNLENELVSAIPSEASTIISIFTKQKLGIINGVKATVEVVEKEKSAGRKASIIGVKDEDIGIMYQKYLTQLIEEGKKWQEETGCPVSDRRFSVNKFRENFNLENKVEITPAQNSKLLTITNSYNSKSWQDWGIVELLGEWVHMNRNPLHIKRYFDACENKGYTPWQQ